MAWGAQDGQRTSSMGNEQRGHHPAGVAFTRACVCRYTCSEIDVCKNRPVKKQSTAVLQENQQKEYLSSGTADVHDQHCV